MAKFSNAELQQQLNAATTQRDNAVAIANFFGQTIATIEAEVLKLGLKGVKRPLLWLISNPSKVLTLISFILDLIAQVKAKMEEFNKNAEESAKAVEDSKDSSNG